MRDECLICGAELVYLEKPEEMVCALCGKNEMSRARCAQGHFVCDKCHCAGLDGILGACLAHKSADPIEILDALMAEASCHMHGPEHHVLIGVALAAAYKNAGGQVDLPAALSEIHSRGSQVPGGVCGFWGACGAGIGAGIFMSVITGANPLSEKEWGLSNLTTAGALERIGKIGGPRCCKRNCYTAALSAADMVREHLGVEMTCKTPVCSRFSENNQCLGAKCPYFPK
ncbi:MAG: SAM-dependent methyltransferase [Oscillospiraceae bacterium]|nr:SAM-dependent methyltransferase [Oscillospiraceae bacterium]